MSIPIDASMEKLTSYILQKSTLNRNDLNILTTVFTPLSLPAKTVVLKAGLPTHHLYFLATGCVKGYKNQDGNIVVEHLIEDNSFFTAMDSFMGSQMANDTFETITSCDLYQITKKDFDTLKNTSPAWEAFINSVLQESLQCKMERINDFQSLTAKARYLKFLDSSPQLALNASIENIASFLGIAPQSLSRIRRELTK